MTAEILTGDAMELIPTLDDESVNLVVTSPPYPGQYGNEMSTAHWLRWTKSWLAALYPKLSANGVISLNIQFKRMFNGWFNPNVFLPADPRWNMHYNLLDIYIYGKSNPPPNGALTYCDPPGWEFIYILTKARIPEDVTFNPVRRPYSPKSITKRNGMLYSNKSRQQVEPHPDGARQTTLMLMSKSADQNRPSAKGISFPRELPARFIRQYTNPGDLVVDPFAGAGTTVRMALELGRRGIGFEIDPDEAEKARGWLREPVQSLLFANGGKL